MNIRIYKYNNYYNRQVKIMTEESKEFNEFIFSTPKTVNWNPNDGVIGEAVFGNAASSYDGSGDYLLAIDSNNMIDSRWFIVDERRERGGQYTLTLRRDLIADFYEDLLDAPIFVEKATLKSSDPFIYNSENMTFNQIKQPETLLRDETNCAWIVGYIDSEDTTNVKGKTFNADQTNIFDVSYNGSYEAWQQSVGISTSNGTFYSANSNKVKIGLTYNYIANSEIYGNSYAGIYTSTDYSSKTTHVGTEIKAFMESNGLPYMTVSLYQNTDGREVENKIKNYNAISTALKNTWEDLISNYNRYLLPNGISGSQISKLSQYNNKILRVKETIDGNEVFRYKYITFKKGNSVGARSEAIGGTLKTTITSLAISLSKGSPVINTGELDTYVLEIIDYNNSQYKTTFPADPITLIDAPYGMFCIPYNKEDDEVKEIVIKEGTTLYPINFTAGFRIAQAIATKLGGLKDTSAIYDLQLLPYCPVRRIIKYGSDGEFLGLTLDNETNNSYCRVLEANNDFATFIFFADKSEFTLNIPIERNYRNKKLDSQTNFYRLVSPNYNGQFEFNLAKNDGLHSINVDCTYKPYNPYIHLNPDFNGLYGDDYNDSRGLICGGDYSLPVLSNAWENYQIQNKNYQNIFDRQIQNLEINNSIQANRDIMNAVTGTINGAIKGASVGSMTGNPWGIAAGAVAGTAESLTTGILNYQWNERLRDEAINYKQDNFGYQLGNIQALPQSISKTTAFTYNNKVFPILEFYDCTEEEKRAFANKIAYNGMTVMRIGTINEFAENDWNWTDSNGKEYRTQKYFKGQLIRLDTIADNFHLVNEIANELNKGVYL